MTRKAILLCLALLFMHYQSVWADSNEPVSYADDVLPILSENCFYCHGHARIHQTLGYKSPDQYQAENAPVLAA